MQDAVGEASALRQWLVLYNRYTKIRVKIRKTTLRGLHPDLPKKARLYNYEPTSELADLALQAQPSID